MACLFCEIVNKKRDADILDEDDHLMVFKDIHPKAPVHLLIVPKKHISSIQEIKESDGVLIGKIFLKARDMGKKYQLDGYRLSFNVGRKGGQLIDHLHLHFMGGWDVDQRE